MAQTITGVVSSDKNDKTIVITVATRKTHPVYRKQYTVNTKFMAHDEKNEAKTGDLVMITASRPLSARKRFTLIKIMERGGIHFEETDATADIPEEQLTVDSEQPTVEKASDDKKLEKSEAKK